MYNTLNEISTDETSSAHYRSIFTNISTTSYPTTNESGEGRYVYNVCDLPNINSFENVTYSVFMALIMIASLAGNSAVILATVLSRQLRIRVTVYLIVSLACSDILNACSQIPFIISKALHNHKFCLNEGACYWMYASDVLCNVASILSLFLIAIDRFIAISMPFKYSFILSVKRAKQLIAAIWLFSGIWTIVGQIRWESTKNTSGILSVVFIQDISCYNDNRSFYVASFLGIYLVPLIFMTFAYCMILHIAISQIRAIEATQIEFRPRTSTSASYSLPLNGAIDDHDNNAEIEKKQKQKKKRQRKRELRATKSVAMVYFAFVVCWLPACVINIIIMYDPQHFQTLKQKDPESLKIMFMFFIQILPMINTMINPIIYSFSNKQFRKGFKSIYNKIMGRLDSPDNSSLDSITRRGTRGMSLAVSMSPSSTCSGIQTQIVNANDVTALTSSLKKLNAVQEQNGTHNEGYIRNSVVGSEQTNSLN